jgi:hypothetical protein
MFEAPSAPVALSELVRVRQSSIRSMNVEQDLENSLIIDEYLLTGQSRSSLSRILSHLQGSSPTRAWTLTGPYGSGKSYFALFLMNLVCPEHPGHARALELLQSVDPILTEQVLSRFEVHNGTGYLAVPMAGYRASLQECLRGGLQRALHPYAEHSGIPHLLTELESWNAHTNSRSIISWLQKTKKVFSDTRLPFHGILFVLDEMGKPLEYAAASPEKADVYVFQELAEYANRSGDFPIIFIGILYQAFERYAALMNSAAQKEWSKVQGRFDDIAFQEPPTQQMRLLVRALQAIRPDEYRHLSSMLRQTADEAYRDGWRPSLLPEDQFIELSTAAYPLHPSALAALPFLFKRLAQNERSLFAFLASSEPFGFQDFLQKHQSPAFLRLPDLFDYLFANFQARLYASGRARALTETIERLASAPNIELLEVDLLKTIGLVNWMAESGGIQAHETVIIGALRGSERSDGDIRRALSRMKDRSLIVFRRYNSTYNIWQGSDVDIEARLDQAHAQLTGAFSFANIVQHYLPPRPLVARRHSYIIGALRYFEVRYVDTSNYSLVSLQPTAGANGLALLALPTTAAETAQFEAWAAEADIGQRADIVVGIAGRSVRLAELAQELRALNWVGENTPELRDDPVARRELRARLAGVEALIRAELDANLKLHRLAEAHGSTWFWQGQRVEVSERGGLSHLISSVCDQLYDKSPRLWNELINRRMLSSQAAAARRNLIEAMLTRADQPRLGIEGFPPERSMYESLLKKGGIHASTADAWQFEVPPENDPLNLKPVWAAISDFIFALPSGPRPVETLFQRLAAPPYGLTEGVLPVVLCAFLQAHASETTLYREGTLLPEPGVADWEVLLRRPELFAVAGCRVDGALRPILERLGRGLRVRPEAMPVVRALVRALRTLPEHAWRTQRLPAQALRLRRAIETAHSPERLLFHDLPTGLDLVPFDEALPNAETIEVFFDRLNLALDALINATLRPVGRLDRPPHHIHLSS